MRVRIIDLYAGVGGWAVGFKLAGFDVVRSYEWWSPAAETHQANSKSPVEVVDIRKLDVRTVPSEIDIVVGSPPCTQFSYSNRGGSGDISDGLVDIVKFLDVVRHVRPTAWAFENVPRVKKVLETELQKGGALEQYADLFEDAYIEVFDMAEFGVPQRRKRCIAGNFNFDLLRRYSGVSKKPTLGDVVSAIKKSEDPLYSSDAITKILDDETEEALSWEEERFNRDMKVAHPIYNGMPFPDPLDRTSRTVTATCTRVSRESLVILDSSNNNFRRLSVRERASLQGFPANFQFLGKNHSEKLKMIGNAIPPIFTYLIAESIKGTEPEQLVLPHNLKANSLFQDNLNRPTRPDQTGRSYPANRRFRFAIPHLRFKSGTRFELSNIDGPELWSVAFYFGDSKRIHRRNFGAREILGFTLGASAAFRRLLYSTFECARETIGQVDAKDLQQTWAHRRDGLHPFTLIDAIGDITEREVLRPEWQNADKNELEEYLNCLLYHGDRTQKLARQKVSRYLVEISVGATIAASINSLLLDGDQYAKQVFESVED
jgi:DNA (cytosine-5)-methyltransferase 1